MIPPRSSYNNSTSEKCVDISVDAVPCLNFIYNLLTYSRGVSPDSPCRGSVLSTISSTIPNISKTNEERRNELAGAAGSTISATSKTLATAAAVAATATGTATATATTSVLHRPRTGTTDQDSSQTQSSPSKSRLNFLEGFRSTLRPRSPVRNNSIPVSNNIEITTTY